MLEADKQKSTKRAAWLIPALEEMIANPSASPRDVVRRLEERAKVTNDADSHYTEPYLHTAWMKWGVPSHKTIERWRATYYDHLNDKGKDQLRTYVWPDSHENGALPWEAAEVGLRLCRTRPDFNEPVMVGEVKWAYWLYCSAPDMPFELDPAWMKDPRRLGHQQAYWCIQNVAGQLYASEKMRDKSLVMWTWGQTKESRKEFIEVVADYLLWKPWVSQESFEHYIANSCVQPLGPIGVWDEEEVFHMLGGAVGDYHGISNR